MATEHNWESYLVFEHELIERGMAVLEKNLNNLGDGLKHPVQLQRALDFLLQFGDKVHNRKEEYFLFPLMEKKGIAVEGGPLGVMVKEHSEERDLLERMLLQLPTLHEEGLDKRKVFQDQGLSYLKIRAEHIWKENDVLYAMGRKVLTEEDNTYLLDAFEKFNQETYGPKAEDHYRHMIEEMERISHTRTRIIDNLTYEQIDAIMETMPVEVTFVDAEDSVAYFNRLDKEKVFTRTRSVIGRKVLKCHPSHSVENVQKIVEGFKDGTLDKAEFWIDFKGDKILIRYFPVHSPEDGKYMGVLEVTQEIGWIQKLEGQKRLLD